MKKILLVLFIAILSSAIFGQNSAKTQDLFIADKMVDCSGVGKQKCLVVRDANSNEWQLLYIEIRGFKFRENYTQKIRVRITPKRNVPADASALDYKLVRTLSRDKTDGKTSEEAQNKMGNQPSSAFTKTEWTLVEINEKAIEGEKPTLAFDEKEGRFGIRICNSVSGAYTLKDDTLRFFGIISTMMACPEPLMGNEVRFSKAIEQVTTFKQTADSLIFFAKGKPVLKFTAKTQAASSSKNLENKNWILTNIGDRQIPNTKNAPFLAFDKEKMRVSGSGGCNSLSGGYEIKNQTLKFGAIMTTRMACMGEKNEIERGFLQALDKVNRFELNGENLNLFDGNTLLLKLTASAK